MSQTILQRNLWFQDLITSYPNLLVNLWFHDIDTS